MDNEATINILLYGNQLKRTTRTGWAMRGVPDPESVAAHSHGVSFLVLVLAEQLSLPIDLGRALAMAVVHDLPEAMTTDIPTPAWRLLPPQAKTTIDSETLKKMVSGTEAEASLTGLWEELQMAESFEARLVCDADKLEMYLQALVYQHQTGNRALDEFWSRDHTFYLPESQFLYDELKRRWKRKELRTNISPEAG